LIGNSNGLTAKVEASITQHKELVQYYSTDWDFMLSRAEVNGMVVCVEAAIITVGPPLASEAATLVVTYGEDMMEFSADLDARSQLTAVESVAWDPATQAVASETASKTTVGDSGNIASDELSKVLGLDKFCLQAPVPE